MPLRLCASVLILTSVTPRASLVGLRVLVVEDDDGIRRPLVRFLARQGAHVEVARDGEEALATLETQAPDVILADLRMPRMGGAQLYERLQGTRPALAARVLFLSGDLTELAQLGKVAPERALAKPVDLGELERRLLEF